MGYQEHPSFRRPENPDAPVWRYLDFTKFVALLTSQELYFARTDLLGDSFEGSYPTLNVRLRADAYRHMGRPEATIEELIPQHAWTYRNIGKFVYANCWTELPHESVALWHMYASMTQGVALRSSFRKLTDALRGYADRPVYVGLVRYINYDAEVLPEGNLFNPFLHKRRAYEFEHELRAVMDDFGAAPPTAQWPTGEGPPAIRVPVNLTDLLERVHVAPAAEEWFAHLVRTVVDRFAPGLEIRPSAMKREPTY
jgi:hypothetical protein